MIHAARSAFLAPLCVGVIATVGLLPNDADAGLKIYYARHGEVEGNVKQGGEMADERKKENSQEFTADGKKQIQELTEEVKKIAPDWVASSPRPRAMNTILPYLTSSETKADVWPELDEITMRATRVPEENIPSPSEDLFTGGRPLRIPRELQASFVLRSDGGFWKKLGEDPIQQEVDKIAVAERLSKLVLERFGGSEKTIILIGHGGNARRFLLSILSYKANPEAAKKVVSQIDGINNGRLFLVEEQADGSFALVMLNGKPFTPHAP